jgi:hypothetical protein
MGHVLFRPGRLKLAAVLPICILWFAFAGTANAAIPDNGTIDQTTNPSTSWAGQFYPLSPTSDPMLCLPFAADAGNTTCDHFELTPTQTGLVRVIATWPGSTCQSTPLACSTNPAADNDFDILVCDNSTIDPGELDPFNLLGTSPPPDACTGGTEVALFATNRAGFEGGTFPAVGGKQYDIRVLAVSITPPGTDYQGCAEYTDAVGTANRCAATPVIIAPPIGASEFASGCAPDAGLQRQVNGGGQLPDVNAPSKDPSFSVSVRRKVDKNGTMHFRGKVNYKSQDLIKFRSQNATCAAFTDGVNTGEDNHNTVFRGKVEVRGFGKMRQDDQHQEQQVCYKSIAQDWGQPGAGKDQFEIDIYSFDPTLQTCSVTPIYSNSGVLTSGNIKYKFVPEGNDEREHGD